MGNFRPDAQARKSLDEAPVLDHLRGDGGELEGVERTREARRMPRDLGVATHLRGRAHELLDRVVGEGILDPSVEAIDEPLLRLLDGVAGSDEWLLDSLLTLC